jgi:hypothetical protein
MGGDVNLVQTDWKGDAEKASRFQAMVYSLVWYNFSVHFEKEIFCNLKQYTNGWN